jgi:uncharacterized SAM-dependent methyltransferase
MSAILNCLNRLDLNAFTCVQISVLTHCLLSEESTLVAAYDDRDGVTAEFNRNILSRRNRELDAGFDPASFRHRAVWNRLESRIEMHLESARAQRVRVGATRLDLHFAAGGKHPYREQLQVRI